MASIWASYKLKLKTLNLISLQCCLQQPINTFLSNTNIASFDFHWAYKALILVTLACKLTFSFDTISGLIVVIFDIALLG